ncbi:hypothetical protein [Streptomyces sp. NBC_00286]|uniref:hypothetical protein n=1 Tax=Streptomyces sp. NBC_00286 TaxID=2975701 RepID=UPI002E2B3654|nr:hypothetical protein [Streptomyces sp. NBC_00286]
MAAPFLRGSFHLALTDRRRSLNLLQGRPTPRWALVAVACCYALGALVGLAAAAGAGALAGHFQPAREVDVERVTAYGWVPVTAALLALAASVRLGQVRQVMFPSDFHVLRTVPVSAGQLLFVRLVGPALLSLAGVGVAGTVFLTCWLEGPPAELAVALVWGTVALGGAAQLAVAAGYLLIPVRAAQLRTFVLVGVAGVVLGAATVPLARLLPAGGKEDTATALSRLGVDALTGLRPAWWNALLEGGAVAVLAAMWLPAAALGALAAFGFVRAGRGRVLREADPQGMRVRGRPESFRAGRSPAALIAAKELRSILRGAHTLTGGLRRIAFGAVLLLGVGVGHLLLGGGGLPGLPFTGAVGVVVGMAALASDEAVQTSGLEAERGCADLLRQSPLPYGALLAGKIVAFAGVVAVLTAPAVAGWLLLFRDPLLPLTAGWLAACVASGVAAVATALAVPAPESAAQTRITRSGTADLLQPLLTAALMAPALLTTSLIGKSSSLLGKSSLAAAVPLAVTFVVLVAAVRWLAGQDRLPRKSWRKHA